MDVDLVVVGSGLFGLTVAREVAERWGVRVLILERRDHVGGNSYSMVDPGTGIEIHRYGAHIFHTSNERVWAYANRFTRFTEYVHRVYTRHRGEVFPMPINLATINQFYRSVFTPEEAKAVVRSESAKLATASRDLEEKAISLIGRSLYEAFVANYTTKQWGTPPHMLPADVIARLPVRYNYDNRYFEDSHQGLPVDGYASWLERMADHTLIEVQLGVDFLDGAQPLNRSAIVGRVPVVFTGPIDGYFDYLHGAMTWRTLNFDLSTLDVGDFQGTAVMNYADLDEPWTRIIEFRHFHPERNYQRNYTVVAREYSRFAKAGDEPFYPVNTPADRFTLTRYRESAQSQPGVLFGGRLGTYRYLDMHATIGSALRIVDNNLQDLLGAH